MINDEILSRLTKLEDIEAIRRLKHSYCYACDDNYNTSKLREVFSSDAVWEAEGFGKYSGIEEICKFFEDVSGEIIAAAHLVMNDVIEVSENGKSASGIWRNCQPITILENGTSQAAWMLARYDEKYIKINDKWFISNLAATIQFTAPYEEGWAAIWPHK